MRRAHPQAVQLARGGDASLQLRRNPVPVKAAPESMMQGFTLPPQDARRTYRSYVGRAISLGAIEVALRAAWVGNMRPLTDISRETLDTDPHLASVVSKRVEALAGLPYEVHPATGYGVDPAKALFYAAVVRDQLSKLQNFRQSLKQLGWALYDGRACLEICWADVEDGQSMGAFKVAKALSALAWIHPRRLSFGPMRELRCTDEYVMYGGNFAPVGFWLGHPAMAYKFVVWTPQMFGEYPEREGLAPRCLYWSFHKRFGQRERMILLELFGKPWRIVEVDEDSQAGDPELLKAEDAADGLGSSYTARMPRGTKLNVVQPQRTAGAIHGDVIEESDRQISKLVLGQTGTTDPIKGGFNNQQANVMQDEQLVKLKGDAVELSEVIENQLTDAIIAYNFGESEVVHAPTFVLRADLPTNRKEEIERISAALEAGLQISVAEAYAVSGFRAPDEGDPYLQIDQPPTQPNSPVAPAPRPVIVYPKNKSPDAGEQQPITPVAGSDKGAATTPSASAGAANAADTITVNEDRAARGLPPLDDPDGDLTISEYKSKKAPKPEPQLPPGGQGGKPGEEPGKEPGKGEPGGSETRVSQPPAKVAASAVELMIRHEGGKWVVYSEDGSKKLGEYDTHAGALKRLRQVEYFKTKAAADSALAAAADHFNSAELHELAMSQLAVTAADVLRSLQAHQSCTHGVALAGDWRHPDTVHGSPDDVVDRGLPEARRAVAKLVGVIDAELEGARTPTQVFAAVTRAKGKMDLHPLARALERRMVHAAALGALDASLMDADAVKAAAGDKPAVKETPFSKAKYDTALRDFRGRNVVRKSAFSALEAKAKQKAFTVAGLASDEMVATVRDELAKQVAKGADIREFRAAMKTRMEDAGWLSKLETLGDGSRALSVSHVDNVFQTNVMGAYNAGRAAQMSEPAVLKRRPVWQIRTAGDNHVRENHANNANVKLLASDPFWQTCYPPFGFRCRCRIVNLTADETENVVSGSTITDLPDEGFTCGVGAF